MMAASAAASTPAHQTQVQIRKVERPTVQAKQAIGVFDSGSGGMVAAAYLSRILRDAGKSVIVVFFGDTANLPYGKKTEEQVAELSDAIITRLTSSCPVIGIACNTASTSWGLRMTSHLVRMKRE